MKMHVILSVTEEELAVVVTLGQDIMCPHCVVKSNGLTAELPMLVELENSGA
jgi:hypothetical protein